MKNQKRNTIASAVLLAIIVVTGGCTAENAESTNNTIRSWRNSDPKTFSPAYATAIDDVAFARLGYDTLLRRDNDGSIIGGLADKWETKDHSVELKIESGRKCPDGTPIDSGVVEDSLNYLIDSQTQNPVTIFGQPAPTVTSNKSENTVTIELDPWYSDVLAGLSTPQSGIVCPAGLKDLDGLAKGNIEDANSGPYSVTQKKAGVSYRFTLNESYEGWPQYTEPLKGKPAEVMEFSIGSTGSVSNRLQSGELDIAEVQPVDFKRFNSDDSFDFVENVTGEHYILFNQDEHSPFRDKEKRIAAAKAIDRVAVRDAINPTAPLEATLGDETMPCANTDEGLLQPYSPDEATAELEGSEIRVIGSDMVGSNGAGNVSVQEQLRTVGAKAQLENLDNGTWITQVYDQPESWDITVMGTVNNLASISYGLAMVTGKPIAEGGKNIGYADNKTAAREFTKAKAATSDDAKCEHYYKAQKAMLDSVDFVPVAGISKPVTARQGFSTMAPGKREDLTTYRIINQ